jgi:hypothetical protein
MKPVFFLFATTTKKGFEMQKRDKRGRFAKKHWYEDWLDFYFWVLLILVLFSTLGIFIFYVYIY